MVASGPVEISQCDALDADGRPIRGLYAVGNDMASVMGDKLSRRRHHTRPRADVRPYRRKAYRGEFIEPHPCNAYRLLQRKVSTRGSSPFA
jgi:hypothetical protein